jgi:hypothetical protein
VVTVVAHMRLEATGKEFSFCAYYKARGNKDITHKAWSELCSVWREVRFQLAWKLENHPVLFQTTVQPYARGPVAPRPDIIRKTQSSETTKIVRETDIGDGARGAKRARQSTLSFATQEDLMEE